MYFFFEYILLASYSAYFLMQYHLNVLWKNEFTSKNKPWYGLLVHGFPFSLQNSRLDSLIESGLNQVIKKLGDRRRFRTTIGQIKRLIDRGQSGPDRADKKKTALNSIDFSGCEK